MWVLEAIFLQKKTLNTHLYFYYWDNKCCQWTLFYFSHISFLVVGVTKLVSSRTAVKYPGSMEHRAPEHNLRLRRWEHNSSVLKARLENNFAQGAEGGQRTLLRRVPKTPSENCPRIFRWFKWNFWFTKLELKIFWSCKWWLWWNFWKRKNGND